MTCAYCKKDITFGFQCNGRWYCTEAEYWLHEGFPDRELPPSKQQKWLPWDLSPTVSKTERLVKL